MTIFIVAAVLVGMAIGLRFKVLVMVPVIVAALICGGAVAVAQGHGWTMIATTIVGIVGLQIGYLCGSFAQVTLRETQVPDSMPLPSRTGAPHESELELSARTQFSD